MYIASAVYEQEDFAQTKLKICTENEARIPYEEIDSEAKVICFHYEHELSQTIMKLAATKELPAKFVFRGQTCVLRSYACNSFERRFNKYRANHVAAIKRFAYRDEIIVYKKRCNCPKCFAQHGWSAIENVCGVFSTAGGEDAFIDIQRCKYCQTYFIDNQSLDIYEKKYGRLGIKRLTMDEFIRRESPWQDTDGFAPDSILSRNGYLSKYDEKRRHDALRIMLYNGISKAEIKEKLSEFIALRGERCYMAIEIWRYDLEYVNYCDLESEEQILFIER